MRLPQKVFLAAFFLLVALAAFPFAWRVVIKGYYESRIYSPATAPGERVAIVFGAAVNRNGRLSSVLQDRMDAAIELYNTGAAQKILVSGDKRIDGYDEPGAMMAYAIQRGVAAEAIQADYGGRRTYDTCYRARHVFQIESALLITQEFHLPRAMFTCSNLGIKAEGIAADMRPYRGSRWYELRETVAGVVAIWDVMRRQAPPVLAAPLSAN